MFIASQGRMTYGPDIRAAVLIDNEIANFYRSLIPPYLENWPQFYKAHITVVRFGKESPADMAAWGKWEGRLIEFEYSNQIIEGDLYFVLPVQSKAIGDIREELGLPRFRHGADAYHITIANKKRSN
jgi:hypothetical protein